jgi:hypothetical protein
MKKASWVRFSRALGLTLAIWPFVGAGGGAEMATAKATWHLPEVGRCNAVGLPGGNPQVGDGRSYDASGVRCVLGGSGCDSHYI